MFVKAGDPLYEGMVIGIHSRDNDLVVNAVRGKQLANFRVSGKEDASTITPPIQPTQESAVGFNARHQPSRQSRISASPASVWCSPSPRCRPSG